LGLGGFRRTSRIFVQGEAKMRMKVLEPIFIRDLGNVHAMRDEGWTLIHGNFIT